MRAVILLLLLPGCLKEERFTEDFIVAQCALLMRCQGDAMPLFDDTASCEAQYADWMDAWVLGCAYDPYKADDCLRAVEGATCDDEDGLASDCDMVYTGECPWAD
ncbi:MAG: hypothetical protein VX265_08150 [Myxococcota bacterium]|nr:hypothetical protein [Myxococcota bacterium]MEC8424801.1 hypothetical protein [Myxococcota bacterium]